MTKFCIFLSAAILASCTMDKQSKSDPLPSWNEGPSKTAIIDFVTNATNETSPSFIPADERIATFDNDGTLWSEQPLYFQLFFVIDELRKMAPEHPEWDTLLPYSAVLSGDTEEALSIGEKGLLTVLMTTHSGMTTDEFEKMVIDWGESSRHPRFNKPYSELVFQPMLELLKYLQENQFKTYIVSGGGIDFMRPLLSDVYSIPDEQIIGSTLITEFQNNDGDPKIIRKPEIHFIDDKAGKPENIQRIIGKKPVISVGNSDGDLAMLQWTSSQENFMNIYIHHTDSVREWAYDRNSHIGRLDKGLDQANSDGWTIVNMGEDWKVIYPFEMSVDSEL